MAVMMVSTILPLRRREAAYHADYLWHIKCSMHGRNPWHESLPEELAEDESCSQDAYESRPTPRVDQQRVQSREFAQLGH